MNHHFWSSATINVSAEISQCAVCRKQRGLLHMCHMVQGLWERGAWFIISEETQNKISKEKRKGDDDNEKHDDTKKRKDNPIGVFELATRSCNKHVLEVMLRPWAPKAFRINKESTCTKNINSTI